MNTVFKLYLQVWVLWGIAAAVSVGTVYARLPRFRRLAPGDAGGSRSSLLVAVAALYPVLAARAKIERPIRHVGRPHAGRQRLHDARPSSTTRAPTCALAYDREAMRWILEHVDGSPVVAEVNTAPTLYGWEGRYCDVHRQPDDRRLGLPPAPAAAAAERARSQQRVRGRPAARTGRTTPRVAYRIFAYYGASYAVVGPLERAYFPAGHGEVGAGRGALLDASLREPGGADLPGASRAAVRSSGSGGSS